MYKTIEDINLQNKTVVLRVDYNVPIKDGKIMDDTRIVKSLKTINYLLDNDCKIVIISHLGKVKCDEDRLKNSLEIVSKKLEELLDKNVTFVSDYKDAKHVVKSMNACDIVMLENTRWYDYPDKLESNCDKEFSEFLASLGEVFVNDAFGTIHRRHASNFGISDILPSVVGYLVEEELISLEKLNKLDGKYVVILGGSKVSDKTLLVEKLATQADYILIGGGMSLTFLNALGLSVGNSKVEEDRLDFCKEIISKYKEKLVLPVDFICNNEFSDNPGTLYNVGYIPNDMLCLDIGFKTIENFKKYLDNSNRVMWNGPLGVYEFENYQNGTKEILEFLKDVDGYKVAGGGDIVSAVNNLGYNEYFSHISTGGGATLSYLQGDELPGLVNIPVKE